MTLESTGALIFDRLSHTVYCNLSQRADLWLFKTYIKILNQIEPEHNWEGISFEMKD